MSRDVSRENIEHFKADALDDDDDEDETTNQPPKAFVHYSMPLKVKIPKNADRNRGNVNAISNDLVIMTLN